jgi:Flp pilus assembly pilin Flp
VLFALLFRCCANKSEQASGEKSVTTEMFARPCHRDAGATSSNCTVIVAVLSIVVVLAISADGHSLGGIFSALQAQLAAVVAG